MIRAFRKIKKIRMAMKRGLERVGWLMVPFPKLIKIYKLVEFSIISTIKTDFINL
jgi:hypothetical protein